MLILEKVRFKLGVLPELGSMPVGSNMKDFPSEPKGDVLYVSTGEANSDRDKYLDTVYVNNISSVLLQKTVTGWEATIFVRGEKA